MSLVGVGITCGIVGSIAINTGNNIQSLGIHQLEVKADEKMYSRDTLTTELLASNREAPGNLCKSKTWLLGTVIFVSGALLNFASFGFAPQSTLASLESIQFVTNLLLGKLLLKKPISRLMYLGTVLIVVGTVVTVSFSSKKGSDIRSVRDMIELWKNYYWIGYLTFLVSVAMLLRLADWALRNRFANDENIEAIIYAVFSALWGTLSVVFAKLLALLLELQSRDIDIFAHWFTYVCLVCWLVLMLYWLYRLNTALGQYNPLLIIPLLQANFIFFATVSGGIYFEEFNYMSKTGWIGFSGGVVLMFSGIFLQIPPRDKSESSLPKLKRMQSNVQQMSVLFMRGTGRINQKAFDVKTFRARAEMERERLSQKSMLTKDERKLLKMYNSALHGAEKTINRQEELRSLMAKDVLTPHSNSKFQSLQQSLSMWETTLKEAGTEIAEQKRKVELLTSDPDTLRTLKKSSASTEFGGWSFDTLYNILDTVEEGEIKQTPRTKKNSTGGLADDSKPNLRNTDHSSNNTLRLPTISSPGASRL